MLIIGCAQDRPVKPILNNGKRIEKSSLAGTFLFAKTITTSQFNGGSKKFESVPVGRSVIQNVLVQFKITEKNLDIVAVDPLFKEEKAALESSLLARFPIKHVDVLRKQNPDGDDTNEEEETDTRRPWDQRTFLIVDTVLDAQEAYTEDTKSSSSSENIEIDKERGAINFTVDRAMKDDSQISQRYSFLRFQASSTYVQKEYPADLQTRFGFFKTTALKFDTYGRITQADRKEFMNRWDTSKKVVYYLSANYPKHLIAPTKQVFANWNESFKAAVGHDVLEVRENSGQSLGDLRYSMITYDETIDAAHGILGYGPTYANPRTGEIIKGDVILYGGVLKSSVYRERIFQKGFDGAGKTDGGLLQDDSAALALQNLANARLGLEELNPEILSGLSGLVSRKSIDREMQDAVKTTYKPVTAMEQIRKEVVSELHQNVTRLNENTLSSIVDGVKTLSDDELEVRIFMPLLTHELGHNWGLRHNFMGSADNNHFARNAKTASIMDYGLLSSEEGTEPAPYDRAAIMVGYGSDAAQNQTLIGENYFYCTDEDVSSSQNAYCNQFDSGSALSQIANNMAKRYDAAWTLNNNRLDRVYFSNSSADYRRRTQMMLFPLRNMYDYASTLVKAIESAQRDEQSAATTKVINLDKKKAIWKLARQRVEVDAHTDPKDVDGNKFKVVIGFSVAGEDKKFASSPILTERQLDKKKVSQVLADARIARVIALGALRDVVLNHRHSDLSVNTDLTSGEVQVRGILFDKMIALSLMAAKLPSPTGDGTAVTTFPEIDDEPVMPTLFRQVISGTILPGEPGIIKDPNAKDNAPAFDINLADLAVDLIKEDMGGTGIQSVMKGLLATEVSKVDNNEAEQKALNAYETSVRDLWKQVILGAATPDKRKEITDQLTALDRNRNNSTLPAQTRQLVGNRVFKAPTYLADFGMYSAAGLFIRDSINPMEQQADAFGLAADELKKVVDAEMAKPEAERKPELIKTTIAKRNNFLLNQVFLNQFIESQKTFLDQIERAYNPR